MKQIKNIPIHTLDFNPNNPRTITQHGFDSLKRSITQNGFVKPIVVNHDMTIIDGHQRVRVMDQLNHKTIPAIVVNVDQQTAEKMGLQLNAAGGRHDFDVLANYFDTDILRDAGFEWWEMGIMDDKADDDQPIEAQPRVKKYRFSIICDDMNQIREMRGVYESKGRRITFDTWREKTFGKTRENDDQDDKSMGSFGAGL